MKQRPIGFGGKPIPFGMLYGDYTPEQIDSMINAPDFEEKCKHAQDNEENMMNLILNAPGTDSEVPPALPE